MIAEFRAKLREGAPRPARRRGAIACHGAQDHGQHLSSILTDAQEAGYVAQIVVRSVTSRRKKRNNAEQRRKLKIGVDIPTPEEVRLIIAKPEGRWRPPLILMVLFCGLRASELRGLR